MPSWSRFSSLPESEFVCGLIQGWRANRSLGLSPTSMAETTKQTSLFNLVTNVQKVLQYLDE